MKCCKCGSRVRFPAVWIMGVETVFKCRECGQVFKTGYRMGAVLFALSLSLSLVTAHLLIYVFSSVTLPVVALLVVPMWLFYGFVLRRAWLRHKYRRARE